MQLLTINQLADASGWPASRIRRLIKTQRLTHLRVDGRTLLPASAIDDFVGRSLIHAREEAGE